MRVCNVCAHAAEGSALMLNEAVGTWGAERVEFSQRAVAKLGTLMLNADAAGDHVERDCDACVMPCTYSTYAAPRLNVPDVVTYAQLNIGRNVGNVPMDDKRWEWFISTAQSVLMGAQHRVPVTSGNAQRDDVQVHRGAGVWGGVAEESAHVSLYWETGMDADYITEQAGVMARMFDQDAIAVILDSTLITA